MLCILIVSPEERQELFHIGFARRHDIHIDFREILVDQLQPSFSVLLFQNIVFNNVSVADACMAQQNGGYNTGSVFPGCAVEHHAGFSICDTAKYVRYGRRLSVEYDLPENQDCVTALFLILNEALFSYFLIPEQKGSFVR